MTKDKTTEEDKVDLIIDDFLDSPYFNKDWEEQYSQLRENLKSLLEPKPIEDWEESKSDIAFNKLYLVVNRLADIKPEKWNTEFAPLFREYREAILKSEKAKFREIVEGIDVSGGGSGRRLKTQLLKKLNEE